MEVTKPNEDKYIANLLVYRHQLTIFSNKLALYINLISSYVHFLKKKRTKEKRIFLN